MNTKSLLTASLAVVATNAYCQKSGQPNVLIIVTDQWRAQAFGYAGDPNVKTPNIDKLAAESINFGNAVTAAPVSSPARACLLTGTFPATHGVFINDARLSPQAVTIGETFKNADYKTGYVGKWHVDGYGRTEPIPIERRHGFDYWKVLECTHNYNQSIYFDENNQKHTWVGYDAFGQTDSTISFLKKNTGNPFLFVVSYGPPHSPYLTAPKKYTDMYDAQKLKMPKNIPDYKIIDTRTNLAGYYAHCTALDDCIGKLLNALDSLNLSDNTIVLFTSDHGEMIGTKGYYDKQVPFDESLRIPFLMRLPGQKPKKIDYPANVTDIFPTMADLCNIAIPNHIQGFSLKTCISTGQVPSKGAYIQSIHPFGKWDRNTGGKEYRAIRTNRYTYVEDLEGAWLLYDNRKDPLQEHNLANKPRYADLQADLKEILDGERKRLNDEFKPSSYYIKQWKMKIGCGGTIEGYEKE